MLYSYFRFKDKHFKTLEFIKDNLHSTDSYLSIKKKIKKLNQYQFFYLLTDLIYHHPIEYLGIESIKLFFESHETIVYDDDYDDNYLPFQDSLKEYRFAPKLSSDISFNSKNELEYLVDYYINTKEYPKDILITKLLVLSDKILEDICQQVIGVRYCFQGYIKSKNNNDDNTLNHYLMEIIKKLKDYEIDLQTLHGKIQERITSLSSSALKNGNYTIGTDNEILKKLYFNLEKYMFIDQTKTSLPQFIEVLKLDWEAHDSIIYLQMDNIQFKYFIDCFNQFLETKIALTFIESSGNIQNKNGKIKANSIYASVSKSIIEPKDIKLIKSFFEEL